MTDTMSTQSISRQVVGCGALGTGASFVDFLLRPAKSFGDTSGFVTGEPLLDQGVEVGMPNLRTDLRDGLDTEEAAVWRLVVRGYGRAGVRLTLGPRDGTLVTRPGSWLGIVRDDRSAETSLSEDENTVNVTSGELTVTIDRRSFGVRVDHGGTPIFRTGERLRQVAGLPVAPAVVTDAATGTVALNVELGPDETITGFGEQFGAVVKNGQHLVLRCEDAQGTATGLAYKPVPVWHSDSGYLGLVNTGAALDVDVAGLRPGICTFAQATEGFDVYLLAGTPRERMADYVRLTGSSSVPPLWAFGYWIGRCRYHSREEVLGVSDGMAHHQIPCDVIHLDPDWLVVDRLNNDFIWNEERFGPRAEFIAELGRHGRRLSLWELPYLDPASPRYADVQGRGYLVHTVDGATAHVERTSTPDGRPRALYDLSNPDAAAWWRAEHQSFLDDGVAVFKTDFGEGLPDDAVLAEDTPRVHHHNLFPLRYNEATFTAMAQHDGTTPLVWARSAWAGSHRYPAQWGGDAESTVAGLRATVRAGISFGLSSPGFWGHDIGGFFGPELSPGLYVRWTQVGALSPMMRAHGLHPREPWEFGDEALPAARRWIRRRYELLPYLWQAAHRSVAEGLPMLRALTLAFPDDPGCTAVDGQFLLGDDLMVVPIFDDGLGPVRRTFYAPPGRWTDIFTGRSYDGARYHTVEVPLAEMPVLARAGAVIPTVAVADDTRSTASLVSAPWTVRRFGPGGRDELIDFSGAYHPVADFRIVDEYA